MSKRRSIKDMNIAVGTKYPYILAVTRDPEQYGYRDDYLISFGSPPRVRSLSYWPAIGKGGVAEDELKEATKFLAAASEACRVADIPVEVLDSGWLSDAIGALRSVVILDNAGTCLGDDDIDNIRGLVTKLDAARGADPRSHSH